MRGLTVLRRGPVLLPGLVLSGLAWSVGWLGTYCCLVAFDIEPAAPAALLVMVVLQIGTALAGSPGGLGVFEYLCVVSLAVFHVPRDVAASCGLLLHVLAYASLLLVTSAAIAWRQDDWRTLGVLPLVYPAIHFAWGGGALANLVTLGRWPRSS